MSDEHIFEYATFEREDWEAHPNTYYFNQTWLRDAPLGEINKLAGLSGIVFRFRRVPKDPLLKAMVLAQVEAAK